MEDGLSGGGEEKKGRGETSATDQNTITVSPDACTTASSGKPQTSSNSLATPRTAAASDIGPGATQKQSISSVTVLPKHVTSSTITPSPVRVVGGPYRHNSVNLITRSTGSTQPNIAEEGDEG